MKQVDSRPNAVHIPRAERAPKAAQCGVPSGLAGSAGLAGFRYRRGATRGDLAELAREISPMETEGMDEGLRWTLEGLFMTLAARERTYTVRLDGRLAGVCFIADKADRREMAFTKTRYLTDERRVAFARGIPQLLRDLAEREREAGRDGKPMYMHVPEGDAKSEAWFVRAGCERTEKGLRCPEAGDWPDAVRPSLPVRTSLSERGK